MKPTFPICTVFLIALPLAGAQVASHAPTAFKSAPAAASSSAVETLSPVGKPVVRVNGTVLTDIDLVREEYSIFPYARQHGGLPPEMAPQIRQGALKMIIFEELVYQEAQRRRLTVSSAKIAQGEREFRSQFSAPQEFDALMQKEFHGSEQLLQEKIRRSLLIEALLKSEVESKSAVSPAEVRAYYETNARLFERPETYTFQTISFLPPRNATPDKVKEGRARADQALAQAKAVKTTEQFGLLAEKISEDDYRVMMGQHKPVPVDQLAPQVVKVLSAMKPGDVSDVIQLEQAFTIVRLNVHTPAGMTPFEDVKARLEKELHEKKVNQLRAELDNKLRQNAKVEEL